MKIVGIVALAAVLLSAGAAAETTREGWYGGLDIGMAIPHEMDTQAKNRGIPTNCDQHLGQAVVNGETLPLSLSDPRCVRGQDRWENSFDLDNGPLLGLNAGYAWRGFRFEAEYFYRQHGGEYSSPAAISGGKSPEFSRAGERMGDVRGHQFFANIYRDFHGVLPKVIPYIGGGIGLMAARMDYSAEFHRNPDRGVIEGYGRNPNAAGTLSSEEEKLFDTLWGYQLMVGADYPLIENVFLGVKARYVDFLNDFENGDTWDRLRSHASTVGPGSNEIRYRVKTDDWGFWGVSLNLKYFF